MRSHGGNIISLFELLEPDELALRADPLALLMERPLLFLHRCFALGAEQGHRSVGQPEEISQQEIDATNQR
jgi:hypothetical protein